MTHVSVNPNFLRWARERAGLDAFTLAERFPRFMDWEEGKERTTLRDLEDFARAVRVPIGYLFLPAPPAEPLPIPDYRTLAGRGVPRSSPNLLDTIYRCQQRQDWYRDYARLHGMAALAFIGSTRTGHDPVAVAAIMRPTLGLSIAERHDLATWTEALRQMREPRKAACLSWRAPSSEAIAIAVWMWPNSAALSSPTIWRLSCS